MTSLAIVAMTDLVLSFLTIFLAGLLFAKLDKSIVTQKVIFLMLFFAAVASLIAGLDHGFFEPIHKRYLIRALSYIAIFSVTFAMFRFSILVLCDHFWCKALTTVACFQWLVCSVLAFYWQSYWLVTYNYIPVLCFFLIANLINYKKSVCAKWLILFVIAAILATSFLFLVSLFGSINLSYILYHLTLGLAAFFLYIAGCKEGNQPLC
jgi:hypothetical protein